MSLRKTAVVEYEEIECCACGIIFAVTALHEKNLRRTHDTFYCPNGHQQIFKAQTDAERLNKELASERQRRVLAENTARAEADRAKAAEDKLARLQHRVTRGVCPCCKRTFANVARHMASKHPEQSSQDNAKEAENCE